LASRHHRLRRSGKSAAGFLAEVLRAWAIFLASLSASGTCARRLGGALGQVRRGRWRGGECRERPQPESRDSPKTAASISRGWPDERIALSRHRTGARSSRRKRGLIRRFGLVFPVAIFAVIAVVGVAVGGKLFAPGSSAFSAVQAIEMVPGSHTMAALETERAQLIAMTTAARTLTVVAKPKLAQPAQVAAANPGTTGGGGSDGVVFVTSTPPNPGSAQSIAYNMMASFGFSPTTFFGCLKEMWNRESGWRYDAENASGAFGIPQALPGSKMASAGADWQTNPATQIKWGLGYIKAIYGDPCKAWAFWQVNHYY
jgi:hypothetical protein